LVEKANIKAHQSYVKESNMIAGSL